jgi:hypothetical protein
LIIEGPNIKQAYRSVYPARLVDIAPTLEVLLGAKPQGQDGMPLADAMVHAPQGLLDAQNNASIPLIDDVSALEREAADRPNTR